MAETPAQRSARERKELDDALTDAFGRDDLALRTALESLARRYRGVFPETIARWAPAAWRRDRIRFRPVLLANVTTWNTAPWAANRGILAAWLAEVEHVRDDELFQRLYVANLGLEKLHGDACFARMRADLLTRWRAAPDRGARAAILERFDLYFTLDEPTAIALWDAEPDLAREFIATRLPSAYSWRTQQAEPVLWKKLWEKAESRDPELFFTLYRSQVPFARWKADVLRLAAEIADARVLNDELIKRHAAHHRDQIGLVWATMLEQRGRDVIPYVTAHLATVAVGGLPVAPSFPPGLYSPPGWRAVLDLARAKQWLDLWVQLLAIGGPGATDAEVRALIDDRVRADAEIRRRLGLLAAALGTRGRWQSAALSDETATALYARFPDLCRGAFRNQVVAHEPKKLLAAALAAGDPEIIDLIAASYLLRYWKPAESVASSLVAHYEGLPDADFARRAGAVLGDAPAFGVWNYSALVRLNPLSHLLFERSPAKFLDDPRVMRDLLESPQIHVQALALRMLAKDDDRARIIAGMCVDLLAPTLLRRLHRRTRILAITALENAATTAQNARVIVGKAREALDLPDDRYPKEAVIGLIGRLIHRWPDLRGRDEQPRIYRAVAS